MPPRSVSYALAAGALLLTCVASADDFGGGHGQGSSVQLGPRPFHLVDGLDEGPLKHRLEQCANGPFRRTDSARADGSADSVSAAAIARRDQTWLIEPPAAPAS